MSHKLRGQGLLELIVALGVITTGVVGTVTLTTSSLASATDTANRVTATYLASEGLEIVRMVRDNNWQAGCPDPNVSGTCFSWDSGLTGNSRTAVPLFAPNTNRWRIFFGPFVLGAGATQLRRSSQGAGLWYQTTKTTSDPLLPYARLLTIDEVCDNDTVPAGGCAAIGKTKIGLELHSTVQWLEQGKTESVTLANRLYNWR